jgi:hypothetical protein
MNTFNRAIIAAVKGCLAVLAALLLFLPSAHAADDLTAAARELARKTSAAAKADPVSLSWRNLSSLDSAEFARTRAAFEAGLQDAGVRINPASALPLRITVSENAAQFLLVAEFQNEVSIAAWKRTGPAKLATPGLSLQSKLLLEQDDPILDATPIGDAVLVLSPSKVALGDRSVAIASAKPWPRDLRGRVRVTGDAFHVYLPGVACTGGVTPSLHMECRNSDEPWVLDSGQSLLLAAFAPGRNFFDGHIVTQTGARKTMSPFYSAAAVDQQGRKQWLLAMLDGRTQLSDATFEPVASVASWGSDIVALGVPCGNGAQVLATRPGDGTDSDAVQAFTISDHTAVPLTPPVPFAGPVTALWPASANTAIAVTHDLNTGKYAAYVLTLSCGS